MNLAKTDNLALPLALNTLPRMIASNASLTPQKTAIICGESTRSWQQFHENSLRVCAALQAAGIEPDDTVAITADNCTEYPEILIGILSAGAVAVPLSTLLNARDANTLLSDADVKAVFVNKAGRHQLDEADGVAKSLRVALDFDESSFTPYETILERPPAAHTVDVKAEDRATIIYSSGTTGIPKGIVHSQLGRTWYASGFAQAFNCDRNSIYLLATGAYSNGSWGMMAPFFYTGGTLIMMTKYKVAESLSLIEKHRVTHSFFVPTQISDVLRSTEVESTDFSSLKMLISMGSYLRPELKLDVLERITPNLYELYGCTEGVITLLEPHEIKPKLETVGRAMTGGEIRLVGDDDQEITDGSAGEIVGWSPYLSRGYHNRDEQNAELLWKIIDGKAFIRTGDMGVLDADGYVKIVGRKKEMIISGGYNVYPGDIEKVIIDYPGVIDCTVAGKEHDRWGEVPFGFIIVDNSFNGSTDGVLEWANEKLSKHQRLHGVKICADFPRNALGKVMKRYLKFD